MIRRLSQIALLAALASNSVACGRGFDIHTPDGFAELDDSEDYAYRATSAEGAVVAVRREANEPKGNLKFWSSAIDSELVHRGYDRDQQLDIKTAKGLTGTQFRYTVNRDGRSNVFWLTVFVTDDHLVIVEAGGDKENFSEVKTEVDRTIRELEVS